MVGSKRKHADVSDVKTIPVTVLSGFLGAGKTTLLNHILKTVRNYAVIVNDMSTVNIDSQLVRKTDEKMIELSNGCICCTLRLDLLDTIRELCEVSSQKLKGIIIESTGIAEPIHVAETIALCESVPNGKGLSERIHIDAMVTVIDSASFSTYFHSTDIASQHPAVGASSVSCMKATVDANGLVQVDSSGSQDHPKEQTLNDLLIDQIQFANIILLNKLDLLSDTDAIRNVTAVIKHFNPYATVYHSKHGNVNPKLLLQTGLYDHEAMLDRFDYFAREWVDTVPETEEYGISSFVFRAKRPFHPNRLHALLNANGTAEWKERRELFKSQVVRSKGFIWLANEDDHFVSIQLTGSTVQMVRGDAWWCKKLTPEQLEEWKQRLAQSPAPQSPEKKEEEDSEEDSEDDSDDDESSDDSEDESEEEQEESEVEEEEAVVTQDEDFAREVVKNMDAVYGDRGQTLVVIGIHLDKEKVAAILNDALVTEEEMKAAVYNEHGQFLRLHVPVDQAALMPVEIPTSTHSSS